MKKLLSIAMVLSFGLSISSCTLFSTEGENEIGNTEDGTKKEKKKLNGVVESKEGDRMKHSITYKDGVRHGEAQDFYTSGDLRSVMWYENGKKEGEAIWYYKEGTVYRVNNYKNGMRHGLQYKYHKNEELLSELEYFEDHPGTGLVEYSKSGRQKEILVELDLKKAKSGSRDILEMRLSNDTQQAKFYVGELTNGKFLNDQLDQVNVYQGVGRIDLGKYKGQTITVTGSYKTRFKNDYIVTKQYQVK